MVGGEGEVSVPVHWTKTESDCGNLHTVNIRLALPKSNRMRRWLCGIENVKGRKQEKKLN